MLSHMPSYSLGPHHDSAGRLTTLIHKPKCVLYIVRKVQGRYHLGQQAVKENNSPLKPILNGVQDYGLVNWFKLANCDASCEEDSGL